VARFNFAGSNGQEAWTFSRKISATFSRVEYPARLEARSDAERAQAVVMVADMRALQGSERHEPQHIALQPRTMALISEESGPCVLHGG
jgi:class 3 adenylate cyclase